MKETPSSDNDWQRIWLSTQPQSWTSLALIPSDAGVEVAGVAESLAATGRSYGERPVTLLDARGVQLANMRQLLDTLSTMTGGGDWVIVLVDSIADNPSSVPIVQAASAALLIVRLGESLLTSARSAIEVVGRSKFLGSIVLGTRGREDRPSFHLTVPALLIVCAGLLVMC